jgi:HlyD family secretion protein
VARQDRTDAEIALAEAEAARREAAATLADLREGSRPEVIAVTEARLAAARVRLGEAERSASRQTELSRRGVVSDAALDEATARRDTLQTEVGEIEAQLAVERLPSRPHVVAAAESRLAGAEAKARQAAWLLEKRDLAIPAAGEVTDVFRRAGEFAGPTTPVLSLLPNGAVKLVVYVGEAEVARLAPGDRLEVRCDGCPEGLAATVIYVASEPEFTPPVIYSLETRQKLVYRVEARPDPEAAALRPGQIVDVARPAP